MTWLAKNIHQKEVTNLGCQRDAETQCLPDKFPYLNFWGFQPSFVLGQGMLSLSFQTMFNQAGGGGSVAPQESNFELRFLDVQSLLLLSKTFYYSLQSMPNSRSRTHEGKVFSCYDWSTSVVCLMLLWGWFKFVTFFWCAFLVCQVILMVTWLYTFICLNLRSASTCDDQ